MTEFHSLLCRVASWCWKVFRVTDPGNRADLLLIPLVLRPQHNAIGKKTTKKKHKTPALMSPARLLAMLFSTLSGLDTPAFSVGGGPSSVLSSWRGWKMCIFSYCAPVSWDASLGFSNCIHISTFLPPCFASQLQGWMKKQKGERVKWRNWSDWGRIFTFIRPIVKWNGGKWQRMRRKTCLVYGGGCLQSLCFWAQNELMLTHTGTLRK